MILVRNFAAFAILITIFAGIMHQGVFTYLGQEAVGCRHIYICVEGDLRRMMAGGAYGIVAAAFLFAAARMSLSSGSIARSAVFLILAIITGTAILAVGIIGILAVLFFPMYLLSSVMHLGMGGSVYIPDFATACVAVVSTAALLSPAIGWMGLSHPDR